MSYEIGDIVVPVVNLITGSGEEINTGGISGTVIDRNLRFTDSEDVSYYNYQVEMSETYLISSGTQSVSIFWFTEEDLGNSGPFSSIQKVDIEGESAKYSEGASAVNSNAIAIEAIRDTMDPTSPYYDTVSTYLNLIQEHQNKMNNYSNVFSNDSTINSTAKAAGKQGEVLGFDSLVFKEMAENALGYHDIFSKLKEEMSTLNLQVEEQNNKAFEDDAENFSVYYNSYVTGGGNNILIPTGYDTETINDNSSRKQESTEPQNLLTLSGLLGEVTFPTGNT